jgi:WD40 repeat protein
MRPTSRTNNSDSQTPNSKFVLSAVVLVSLVVAMGIVGLAKELMPLRGVLDGRQSTPEAFLPKVERGTGVEQLRFTPDDKLIFGSLGDRIQVWDARTGDEKWSAPLPTIVRAGFSPIGSTRKFHAIEGGTRYLVDIDKRDISCTDFESPLGPAKATFSWDGMTAALFTLEKQNSLAIGGFDAAMRPWSRHLRDVPAGWVLLDFAISPNGKRVAISTHRDSPRIDMGKADIEVFDVETGELLYEISGRGGLSALGHQVDCYSTGTTQGTAVWRHATEKPIIRVERTLRDSQWQDSYTDWFPDENHWIDVQGEFLRIYDLRTGKIEAETTLPESIQLLTIAVSSDFRTYCAAFNGHRTLVTGKITPVK